MSIIMDAWRQRGYAPPGSERMLQDYEDALQLERDKQSLIFALTYLPAEPPPSAAPPASPEYTGEALAGPYMPSNGPEPTLQPEDPPGGSLGLAGGTQAARKMPDVGGDAYTNAFAEKGIRVAAPALDTNDRAETAGGDSRWAAIPATKGNAYLQPDFRADQTLQDHQIPRPAWADHIAGIDTPTLEAILAQRYAMLQRGGQEDGPSVNARIDNPLRPALLRDDRQESPTPADPYAPMVQNLSNRVVNAGGGRGFVNPADASTHGSTSFAGRSTIVDSKAYGEPRAQQQADPRERELQLLRMSNEPAEAHSAAEWAAAAQEYKELQIRQGRKFSRDSFYNGLWTKGMAAGAAAGRLPERGDFNDMAGLAGEANVHSEMGTAAGGAVGAVLGKNGARFLSGAVVLDKKTGKTFQGTVDLGPTFDRINQGIAHPHYNDGSEFRNKPPKDGIRRLPVQPSGYYKEYVIPTPGGSAPGPQRLVLGRDGDVHYTPDHYENFIQIE